MMTKYDDQKCADYRGPETNEFAVFGCHGEANQRFKFHAFDGKAMRITTDANPSKCLEWDLSNNKARHFCPHFYPLLLPQLALPTLL